MEVPDGLCGDLCTVIEAVAQCAEGFCTSIEGVAQCATTSVPVQKPKTQCVGQFNNVREVLCTLCFGFQKRVQDAGKWGLRRNFIVEVT